MEVPDPKAGGEDQESSSAAERKHLENALDEAAARYESLLDQQRSGSKMRSNLESSLLTLASTMRVLQKMRKGSAVSMSECGLCVDVDLIPRIRSSKPAEAYSSCSDSFDLQCRFLTSDADIYRSLHGSTFSFSWSSASCPSEEQNGEAMSTACTWTARPFFREKHADVGSMFKSNEPIQYESIIVIGAVHIRRLLPHQVAIVTHLNTTDDFEFSSKHPSLERKQQQQQQRRQTEDRTKKLIAVAVPVHYCRIRVHDIALALAELRKSGELLWYQRHHDLHDYHGEETHSLSLAWPQGVAVPPKSTESFDNVLKQLVAALRPQLRASAAAAHVHSHDCGHSLTCSHRKTEKDRAYSEVLELALKSSKVSCSDGSISMDTILTSNSKSLLASLHGHWAETVLRAFQDYDSLRDADDDSGSLWQREMDERRCSLQSSGAEEAYVYCAPLEAQAVSRFTVAAFIFLYDLFC